MLFWNISRGRASWPRIADEISAIGAELIILGEAGKPDAELREFWRGRFPQQQVSFVGGGLIVVSPAPLRNVQLSDLDGISSMVSAQTELPLPGFAGQPVRLVVVDLDASPRFHKGRLVQDVFDEADRRPNVPTIVVGDFNTPIDSRWFSGPRERYTHAFEQSGSGWFASWPARFPVVAIDHLWLSPGLSSSCTVLPWTFASDHRPLVSHVRAAAPAANLHHPGHSEIE